MPSTFSSLRKSAYQAALSLIQSKQVVAKSIPCIAEGKSATLLGLRFENAHSAAFNPTSGVWFKYVTLMPCRTEKDLAFLTIRFLQTNEHVRSFLAHHKLQAPKDTNDKALRKLVIFARILQRRQQILTSTKDQVTASLSGFTHKSHLQPLEIVAFRQLALYLFDRHPRSFLPFHEAIRNVLMYQWTEQEIIEVLRPIAIEHAIEFCEDSWVSNNEFSAITALNIQWGSFSAFRK
ncbi:hypothetical protein [Neptuniibacter sp. QD37_11]|uniref:hypothetical protein n=1 Tax=Neptuniibacter sp. QD37_11 TaxID=3398209 RepID=UPI0039F5FC38